MIVNPTIEEKEKFSKTIISLVEKDKISYIDAITEYCSSIELEIDIAAKLLTPSIIAHVSEEAMKSNLIPKYPTLLF